MPTLGAPLDFAKLEARNMQAHQLGTAPSTPVKGQLYFNTADNTLWWWDGSAWVSARGGASATPPATTIALGTIQLAGDLAGTATSPQIAPGVITDAEVAAANKDGGVGVASMRTLGSGAAQAAPGNDARFTAAPQPHHASHESGGSDAMAADVAAGTPSLRSLGNAPGKAMSGQYSLGDIGTNIVTSTDVHLNNRKIINLLDPTAPQEAATKFYVDSVAQGLDAKQSVKVASTAEIAVLNGTMTIDGVAVAAGDRVLVKDQTGPLVKYNGIYIVAAGAWSRASDMDSWSEVPGAFTFVEQGTTQSETGWVCISDQGGTIGTTNINFVQFSGAGQVISGAGLTKTGNTLDVGAGAGITVGADTVGVANNGITNAMIADGAVDLSTADVTGTLPIGKGGTGTATGLAANGAGYYSTATHGAGTTISIPKTTHGLRASRGLLIQVQDETTGNVELPDVSIAASGDVTITYAVAVSANSKRVTVIG